jgi:hypothetical protein
MPTTMTQSQLLETLQTKRIAWDNLLAQVDAQHMLQPGAAGIYSVKDVIAHIAVYEEWVATILEKALRDEHETPPASTAQSKEQDVDAENAQFYAEYRDRSLSEIQQFSQQAYQHLLTVISTLTNDQINAVLTPEWTTSPTWKFIAGDSYDHYEDHIPSLQAWIAQQNQ